LVIWLTGLPGCGKSSVATATQKHLHAQGYKTALLDGDNLRHGLCADLGFSMEDRRENVRRASEVAKLFLAQGAIVLVALVSPQRSAREEARQCIGEGDFMEVWCQCPSAVCATRDIKGHYAKAKAGVIADFTGVSSPYEEPLHPALKLDTAVQSIETSVAQVIEQMMGRVLIGGHTSTGR
jgi:adenylylsulfate kinase